METVRNKTIIGLKSTFILSTKNSCNVRNKTIIGLKSLKHNFTSGLLMLEIRL